MSDESYRKIGRIVSVLLMTVLVSFSGCASSGTRTSTREDRAAVFVDAAYQSLLDGEPITALQHLEEAQKIDPKMPELYHTRALVYAFRHEYRAAIKNARKAVELNPKYSAANNTLGKLLMDTGKPDEAVRYLKAAANDDLYRGVEKPLTNLGILYYRKMDYKTAAMYLDRAVRSDPNGACIAYYYRGHIHLHYGQFSQAIHDYDQATRRFCADFAQAHLALGIAYERSHQYDQARKVFLEIRDRFATSPVSDEAMNQLKGLP